MFTTPKGFIALLDGSLLLISREEESWKYLNNVIKSWKQPGKKEKLHVDGSVFKLRELYKFNMGFAHFQLGQNNNYSRDIIEYQSISLLIYNWTLPFIKIFIGTDWKLHLDFVEPAYLWASGSDILEVHKKCEIFEGTFIRNILRINNIVDNVKTLAEHINKPHLLERLDSIERLIVRDQVTTDSLYISKSTRK